MSDPPDPLPDDDDETNLPHHRQTERFGGGHIRSRHGRINLWLVLVYGVMFAWSLYYGIVHWGGLGPGLDLGA